MLAGKQQKKRFEKRTRKTKEEQMFTRRHKKLKQDKQENEDLPHGRCGERGGIYEKLALICEGLKTDLSFEEWYEWVKSTYPDGEIPEPSEQRKKDDNVSKKPGKKKVKKRVPNDARRFNQLCGERMLAKVKANMIIFSKSGVEQKNSCR